MRTEIRVENRGEVHQVGVASGTSLRQALLENGLSPYQGPFEKLNCKGLGVCGSCMVWFKEGQEYYMRRSCQVKCYQPIEVRLRDAD